MIRRPGATRSGLAFESAVPHDENAASVSTRGLAVPRSSAAPTVITYGSMPGEATVSRAGPVFPAVATTTSPRRHAISTAADSGSVRYDVGVGAPNERLMTRMLYVTRLARTHSIPRMTEEIRPLPWLLRTRTS